MGVTVKVRVCADCFGFHIGQYDETILGNARMREITTAFANWGAYHFVPRQCTSSDFLDITTCGICGASLTNDRRHHDDQTFANDRRSAPNLDRRSPFNRGSRVLLASVSAA